MIDQLRKEVADGRQEKKTAVEGHWPAIGDSAADEAGHDHRPGAKSRPTTNYSLAQGELGGEAPQP